MAAILNIDSGTRSGNVRCDIFKSGMVDNVGIAIGIAAPSLVIQKLFPLSVSLAVILNFGSRTMSGNVRSDIFKSGMVDNVGIAAGIVTPSLAVQNIFPLGGSCWNYVSM